MYFAFAAPRKKRETSALWAHVSSEAEGPPKTPAIHKVTPKRHQPHLHLPSGYRPTGSSSKAASARWPPSTMTEFGFSPSVTIPGMPRPGRPTAALPAIRKTRWRRSREGRPRSHVTPVAAPGIVSCPTAFVFSACTNKTESRVWCRCPISPSPHPSYRQPIIGSLHTASVRANLVEERLPRRIIGLLERWVQLQKGADAPQGPAHHLDVTADRPADLVGIGLEECATRITPAPTTAV